jgi:hypothetical protein
MVMSYDAELLCEEFNLPGPKGRAATQAGNEKERRSDALLFGKEPTLRRLDVSHIIRQL